MGFLGRTGKILQAAKGWVGNQHNCITLFYILGTCCGLSHTGSKRWRSYTRLCSRAQVWTNQAAAGQHHWDPPRLCRGGSPALSWLCLNAHTIWLTSGTSSILELMFFLLYRAASIPPCSLWMSENTSKKDLVSRTHIFLFQTVLVPGVNCHAINW